MKCETTGCDRQVTHSCLRQSDGTRFMSCSHHKCGFCVSLVEPATPDTGVRGALLFSVRVVWRPWTNHEGVDVDNVGRHEFMATCDACGQDLVSPSGPKFLGDTLINHRRECPRLVSAAPT
jgi:hypothetical protein